MTPQEFAQKIKSKYPQYQNIDDVELSRRIIKKYPQYAPQVEMPVNSDEVPSGILAEARQDLSQVKTGISESLNRRADKVSEIQSALRRGDQGKLRSFLQIFGQGAGAASDVIGEAVLGAGKAVLPQRAEEAVGGAVEKVAQGETVQKLVTDIQEFKEENPELGRDLEAAFNTILLGADVATGGITGRGVKTVAREGTEAAGRAAGKATSITGKIAGKTSAEIEGALTGTSAETLIEGFRAVRAGDESAEAFVQALRSQTTPEEIVQNLRNAVDSVETSQTRAFRESLDRIGNETVSTRGIINETRSKLDDFGITVKDGKLDFSNSKLRTVPQARNKVETLWDEIKALEGRGEIPLRDLDTTRQALGELLLVGDDPSATAANNIITDIKNRVKDIGINADNIGDDYAQMLSEFGENAEFLNEIKKGLATQDSKTIDQTYRRLATSLKTNNEQRMALLKELDDIADGSLIGSVAGQQLSEIMPRGIIRAFAASLGGAGFVLGGAAGASSALVPLIIASPRVVGEVVNALGLSARKTRIIIDSFKEAQDYVKKVFPDFPIPVPSAIEEGINQND